MGLDQEVHLNQKQGTRRKAWICTSGWKMNLDTCIESGGIFHLSDCRICWNKTNHGLLHYSDRCRIENHAEFALPKELIQHPLAESGVAAWN
jgi:hypothetical protein